MVTHNVKGELQLIDKCRYDYYFAFQNNSLFLNLLLYFQGGLLKEYNQTVANIILPLKI